jgi:hypothetical protein
MSQHHEIEKRRGHSMMEMIVVMSVLAGIAAVSWPMLKSPLNKLRLQAAAQEVSTELSKARLKAMQSGVAQVFRYQVNTGKFQVAAASDEDSTDGSASDQAEPLAVPTDQLSLAEHSPLSEEADFVAQEKELPEGICFEMPANEDSVDSERTEVAADEQGWTDLAIFYPNGDTTNAVIGLRSESDLHLDVKLSGLTGTAKIGEAHRQELK